MEPACVGSIAIVQPCSMRRSPRRRSTTLSPPPQAGVAIPPSTPARAGRSAKEESRCFASRTRISSRTSSRPSCCPNQEFREVAKNAEEAVAAPHARRRPGHGGRIEFDVDWPMLERDRQWFICCADNGDGMTRVGAGAVHDDARGPGRRTEPVASRGNQGMGLKISRPDPPQAGRADPLAQGRRADDGAGRLERRRSTA